MALKFFETVPCGNSEDGAGSRPRREKGPQILCAIQHMGFDGVANLCGGPGARLGGRALGQLPQAWRRFSQILQPGGRKVIITSAKRSPEHTDGSGGNSADPTWPVDRSVWQR